MNRTRRPLKDRIETAGKLQDLTFKYKGHYLYITSGQINDESHTFYEELTCMEQLQDPDLILPKSVSSREEMIMLCEAKGNPIVDPDQIDNSPDDEEQPVLTDMALDFSFQNHSIPEQMLASPPPIEFGTDAEILLAPTEFSQIPFPIGNPMNIVNPQDLFHTSNEPAENYTSAEIIAEYTTLATNTQENPEDSLRTNSKSGP